MSATIDNGSTALLIEVTDFTNNASDPLGTYLRLGAVPTAIVSAYDSLNDDNAVDDDAALTTTSGEDLARQVMGFVDDDRDRGSGSFFTMTSAARKAESELLHTLGGWRDHTDGNRVTTTRGDKAEVIGGNYKMLVLGREQWNTDANNNAYGVGLHNESSGGITYHYDEVPGQIIDVRRASDGSTWNVIEECQTGHFVARYHGVDKDWHQGGALVTRVGSLGAYEVAYEGASWDAVSTDLGFEDDADFDKPDNAAHQAGVAWPGDSTLPAVREEIFANTVKEKTFARTISDKDGSQERKVHSITEKVYATTIWDFQMFVFYQQKMYGDDLMVHATESWEGLFFELFVTAAITAKLGLFSDLRYGYGCFMLNAAMSKIQVNLTLKRVGIALAVIHFNLRHAPIGKTFRLAAQWNTVHNGYENTFAGVKKLITARFDAN